MTNDTCPHCCAESVSSCEWKCGTESSDHGFLRQSPDCMVRCLESQLSAVTAERDGWKRSKERWARASMRERTRAEEAERQLAEVQQRIDAAPVVHMVVLNNGQQFGPYGTVEWAATLIAGCEPSEEASMRQFRLVAEPEPAQEQ